MTAEEDAKKEAERLAKLALIADQRAKEEEEREYLKQQQQENNNSSNESGNSGSSGSNSGNGNSSSSSTPSFTDKSGCDGMVYYDEKTGIFYRPDSSKYPNGKEEFKGSAPYGYNKFFYQKLTKLVDDARTAGYTITPSIGDGAFRSYERQQYFYSCYTYQNCNNGNLAANPGTSNHGWGIASDLSYGSQGAITWAHTYASNYGLGFSVSSENWHIDPLYVKVDNSVVDLCK